MENKYLTLVSILDNLRLEAPAHFTKYHAKTGPALDEARARAYS